MKEPELYELLPLIWEELGKTSITIGELNQWCDKYREEHSDVYVWITKADLGHVHDCNYVWWEIRNENKGREIQVTDC